MQRLPGIFSGDKRRSLFLQKESCQRSGYQSAEETGEDNVGAIEMLYPKFLIFDDQYAICLNPAIGHNTVEIKPQHLMTGKITGAGSFKIVDGRVCVFGHSHSLGITAKPSDAVILEQTLRIGDYRQ